MQEHGLGFGILDASWIQKLKTITRADTHLVFIVYVFCRNVNTGEAYPSVLFVAEFLGISERTVRRAINDLVKAGLLVLVRKHTGKKGEPNVYRVAPAERFDALRKTRPKFPSNGKPSPKRQPNDVLTPDISEGEREAGERTLAALKEAGLWPSFHA
jgi:DNA-binding transcriptional regulator PaaX